MLVDILYGAIATVILALLIALVYAVFSRTKAKNRGRTSPDLKCSFCRKSQDDVLELFAGPTVFICDECVDVCNDLRAADQGSKEKRNVPEGRLVTESIQRPTGAMTVRCVLCRMPVLANDALMIEKRGLVCAVCVNAFQTAAAMREQRND
jgi:hypothetical protein